MKFFIRNMISSNCIPIIRIELNKLGYQRFSLTMGELEITEDLTSGEQLELKTALIIQGYSLLDEKSSKLILDVKKIIVTDIFFSGKPPIISYNTLLSKETGVIYEGINILFTEIMGMTIERYVLLLKLEKAKELLINQNLPMTTIAINTGFFNAVNLVNHFKRNIGITPSQFKIIKMNTNLKNK